MPKKTPPKIAPDIAAIADQAEKLVIEERICTVSGLQRRLNLGYNNASELMEVLEIRGVVGPAGENGVREILDKPILETESRRQAEKVMTFLEDRGLLGRKQPELPGMPPKDRKKFLVILHDPVRDGHGTVNEIVEESPHKACQAVCHGFLESQGHRLCPDLPELWTKPVEALKQSAPWMTIVFAFGSSAVVVSAAPADEFAAGIYKSTLAGRLVRALDLDSLNVMD